MTAASGCLIRTAPPTTTTSATAVSAPRGRHRWIKKSGVKKLDLSSAKKTFVSTSTCQHGGSSSSPDRPRMALRAFDSSAFRIRTAKR
jgi:hypothetical protein